MPRTILVDTQGEMSVTQAAKVLGVNHKTIRKAIADGSLPAYAPRGRSGPHMGPGMGWRIKDVDLVKWWRGDNYNDRGGPYGESRNPSGVAKPKEATE